MAKILIADDDPNMVLVLSELLKELKHDVLTAGSAPRAFELTQTEAPDLVLADIEMPEGRSTGLDLLRQIKELSSGLPVIMITGNATKERAVAALRAGAQDFVEKPFRIDELRKRVENALLQRRGQAALAENVELRRQVRDRLRFDNLVGTSAAMEAVYRMMERVANTDATVLVLGESGTGKELVARALHFNSRRAPMPFVAVNCAALPEHLLESELFGHRKGAFTGAAFDKIGLFQYADGGTIFLDEVGSMALSLQSKLLRFLQDKELRRVGDTETTKVDVRVIAATNEPLQAKLQSKQFREDLYYRLSVIPIELPPLRDRSSDIPPLTKHFLQEIAARASAPVPSVPDEVMAALTAYHWPGNVRELQNALERAAALCDGGAIALRDLPVRVLESVGQGAAGEAAGSRTLVEQAAGAVQWTQGRAPMELKEFLHQQEVRYIEQAIAAAEGNKDKAAEMLGISMATLYRKLAPPAEGVPSEP
jgi:DNA-binding NtrC family response regulator